MNWLSKDGLYVGRRNNDLYEIAENPLGWDEDDGFINTFGLCRGYEISAHVCGINLKPGEYVRLTGPIPHGPVMGGEK